MHNQYTDLLLDLPEVKAIQVLEIDERTIHIEVSPCSNTQHARSVDRKSP